MVSLPFPSSIEHYLRKKWLRQGSNLPSALGDKWGISARSCRRSNPGGAQSGRQTDQRKSMVSTSLGRRTLSHLHLAGKGMLRIVGQLLHPVAKLRWVDAQILRRLHIRYASILDQAHSLKLELPRELPPLHDAPPVPSKHLTRCLRNRVQASQLYATHGIVRLVQRRERQMIRRGQGILRENRHFNAGCRRENLPCGCRL